MTIRQYPTATGSLLIVEIGNSHIALAASVAGEITNIQRMALDELDEFNVAVESPWESLPEEELRDVAVASVVPETLERVVDRLRATLHVDPKIVGRSLALPLPIAFENPATLGVDRVCAAAAAYQRDGQACAVASFGTATTIDCVNGDGVFLGGAILPGLALQAAALHEKTAALPLVQPRRAEFVYGTTTEEAINNGVIYGSVGALREIVERYATDLGRWPTLVLTGGFAPLIAEACDFVDAVIPDLCIRGIALAYARQANSGRDS